MRHALLICCEPMVVSPSAAVCMAAETSKFADERSSLETCVIITMASIPLVLHIQTDTTIIRQAREVERVHLIRTRELTSCQHYVGPPSAC
jgi:hypothetical protein